ncbi:uncharacterized protein DUF4302 [Chitinophaga skermanii]|uniref:Uncharacterized protein DUF4302 n=1 Tax=Chitinophaga skermanii TaxID=331697 RepID=A0A327QY94_9BACT|nr:DUF4302 domain-containing protein [Chitinophaga skermanii]RAJ08582.1 uncharacterized protein DUF4302 [Chitinophaga skermanii]
MKKFLYFTLATALALGACSKSEDFIIPVEKSYADTAVNLSTFSSLLNSAKDGWAVTVIPKDHGIYSAYIRFDSAAKSFTSITEYETKTASSKYELTVTGQLNSTLTLATGNSFELLPVETTRSIDESFNFVSNVKDTVRLRGARYGDELILTKATTAERTAYEAGALNSMQQLIRAYYNATLYPTITTPGGEKQQLDLSPTARFISLFRVANNLLEREGTDMTATLRGIKFRRPLFIGKETVSELLFDQTEGNYFTNIGTQKVFLVDNALPNIPLHLALGKLYPATWGTPDRTFFPEYGVLPGNSVSFKTAYDNAKAALLGMGFSLYGINYTFVTASNIMNVDVFFVRGSTIYQGQFGYNYVKNANGQFTFTARPFTTATISQNASFIRSAMLPYLNVLVAQPYTVGYYDAYQTLGTMLAQFKGVNDPTMEFTGFFASVLTL